MTAVVGSAAEDTTPSEREAPARFAWWHPQSADLGRRAEARRQHARRNDLWVRPAACEAPIIPRPLPPPSTRGVSPVIDGPVFAPVDPPTPHNLRAVRVRDRVFKCRRDARRTCHTIGLRAVAISV